MAGAAPDLGWPMARKIGSGLDKRSGRPGLQEGEIRKTVAAIVNITYIMYDAACHIRRC